MSPIARVLIGKLVISLSQITSVITEPGRLNFHFYTMRKTGVAHIAFVSRVPADSIRKIFTAFVDFVAGGILQVGNLSYWAKGLVQSSPKLIIIKVR